MNLTLLLQCKHNLLDWYGNIFFDTWHLDWCHGCGKRHPFSTVRNDNITQCCSYPGINPEQCTRENYSQMYCDRGYKRWCLASLVYMITSSNGNIFHVTGPFYGKFTGDRWIPRTKASDAELWCLFFICAWINNWVNSHVASDLGRHRAYYGDIVMCYREGVISQINVWLQNSPSNFTTDSTVMPINYRARNRDLL